jgi:hypothetical protein
MFVILPVRDRVIALWTTDSLKAPANKSLQILVLLERHCERLSKKLHRC